MNTEPKTSSRHFTPRQLAAALGIDPDQMHWKAALIGKLFQLFPDLAKCCHQDRLEQIALGNEPFLEEFSAAFTITEPRRLDGPMRGRERVIHGLKNNIKPPEPPVVRLNAAENLNFGKAKTAAAFNVNSPQRVERTMCTFSATGKKGRARMIAAFEGKSFDESKPGFVAFSADEMAHEDFKKQFLAAARELVKRITGDDSLRIKSAQILPFPAHLR